MIACILMSGENAERKRDLWRAVKKNSSFFFFVFKPGDSVDRIVHRSALVEEQD